MTMKMKYINQFAESVGEAVASNIMTALAVILLILFLCATARAEPSSNHHFNVVFSPETTIEEVTWQALNVVDGFQTVYIANHPAQFQEVDQALTIGQHPSKRGAIIFTAVIAVAHYAVTVGLENLVQENQDYRVLQRTWQLVNIGAKGYTVAKNNHYGIQP